jgi:signal transduction histidine kinase/ActR/RegA family two-component response regulator
MARILVVDDQKIPRVAVAASLGDAGHEVRTAESGEEGLSVARDWCPDVIVLDVYMPGLDGFQVVERLKEDPVTEPMPVIFLTADPPTDEVIVRGLDLGAYDFLTKDCSRAELLARVGVMARIKRSTDELSALARISDSLIQSLDPAEVGRRFVTQVQEVFRARAALLFFNQTDDQPPFCAAAGLDSEDPLCEPLIRSLLERLGSSDSNPAVLNLETLRGPEGVLVRRHGLTTAVATRLQLDDRPPILLAVLTERQEGLARSSDAPLLRLLARQASIALDNALLHVRTREQARKMEEQADKLEQAMSERSRFFASMSHELRTPINAVIGYNQLLQLGSFGEMTEAQAKAVESVGRSAQHLLELINDVLDISKIEAGKLEVLLEPVDIPLLVRDTVTSVQLQAEQKGLALEMELADVRPLVTDAARVRQILLNLLSNAVKFTAEGRVSVHLEDDGENLHLAVEDTGPGIDPDDLERVFEEFEQSHRGHSRGGTGLGLAISRRLALLLGGRLELQSTVGKGTVFTLILPRTPPTAQEPLPQPE